MAEKGDHGQESRDAADRNQVTIELFPVPETFHEWFLTYKHNNKCWLKCFALCVKRTLTLTFVCVRTVLNLYPHVDQCTLAHDHDKGGDENDEWEPLRVPPEDSNEVWNEQYKANQGWEAVGLIGLDHGYGLHNVAQAGTQDHSQICCSFDCGRHEVFHFVLIYWLVEKKFVR